MTLLRTEVITKIYPGVVANRHISLDVRAGEIHALLGENGAGKSTLSNILYGATLPDHGQIFWNEQPVHIDSTRRAIELGIGKVHQHFTLVPTFTTLENIILQVRPSVRNPWLSLNRVRPAILKLCEEFNLTIDLDQKIDEMPLAMQQRVEIVKALLHDARLVILDEPTAVLPPQEVQVLFAILRRLVRSGHAVLLVSHRLEEVMAISDRVSVLRDGTLIATLNTAETNANELARLMVGRPVALTFARSTGAAREHIAPAIVIEDLHVTPDQGHDGLHGVSLSVYPGEILGIAGIDGNGQRALLGALCGVRRPSHGKIVLLGQDTTHFSPRQLTQLNIGRIPDDRQTLGLLLDMRLSENLIVQQYNRFPFSIWGWLRRKRIAEFARELVAAYDIRTPNIKVSIGKLSGGNQQKTILAREMHHAPAVLIVANPTRGLDIGASEYIYRRLLEQRANGTAMLLISSDLGEVINLSDRIAVLHGGKIMGILTREAADRGRIGLMMAGIPG